MFIVEMFLPLHDNDGAPFASELFASVRSQLAQRFGGVTAFTRSPAVGIWRDEEGVSRRDEIVVFEVMTGDIDVGWWQKYRSHLERTFRQDEILIRATRAARL